MSEELHVIFGTGPVGCWTATALRAMDIPVRVVNRTGKRPNLLPDDVEVAIADISEPKQALKQAKGASVIYQALNPPYHQWHQFFPALQRNTLDAAKSVGARYVSIENLYMYDASEVITEDSPIRPLSKKGELRAQMAEELFNTDARGEVKATALRSSDYFGPGVLHSALGEMVFKNLIKGKKAQLVGSAQMLHSWAYIEDVGKAAALLGTQELACGKAWIAPHASPETQRRMVEFACNELGMEPSFSVMSPFMMRIGGFFIPAARETIEMMYQFMEPFQVDSEHFSNTFDLKPTQSEEAIKRTVNWFKSQHSH